MMTYLQRFGRNFQCKVLTSNYISRRISKTVRDRAYVNAIKPFYMRRKLSTLTDLERSLPTIVAKR